MTLFTKILNKLNSLFIYPFTSRIIFRIGYHTFLKTGVTPQKAYHAFIYLYCKTNGKINENYQKLIQKKYPAKTNTNLRDKTDSPGTFGNLNAETFTHINETLNKDGYYHFPQKLSSTTVEKLYQFALKTPGQVPSKNDLEIFKPGTPTSEIYRFTHNDILSNPDIQEIALDPSLIQIARNYFKSEPILDIPGMWWSTDFLKEASAEAAQLYHFDLERFKWLKLFIYLNDVTPENGPHHYINGSHRVGQKPQHLLQRLYARIPDSDLKEHYKSEDFVEVCGEAGSAFIGDTKCWHKGTALKKGHRLVLELQYTSSLFGTNYPKMEIRTPSEKLKRAVGDQPFYCQHLSLKTI